MYIVTLNIISIFRILIKWSETKVNGRYLSIVIQHSYKNAKFKCV